MSTELFPHSELEMQQFANLPICQFANSGLTANRFHVIVSGQSEKATKEKES